MNLNEMRKIAGIPLKEDFDKNQSVGEASKLVKLLKDQFSVPVDSKINSDGSVTITVNNGNGADHSKEGSNPNVVTPQNLSKAIDKPFRDFRAKGWSFTQPVKYSFTVGVPE
jgi:hypothetical protein